MKKTISKLIEISILLKKLWIILYIDHQIEKVFILGRSQNINCVIHLHDVRNRVMYEMTQDLLIIENWALDRYLNNTKDTI